MDIRTIDRRSSRFTVKVILLVLSFTLLLASVASADLFIKFDVIKGGSTEAHHRDWCDVLSVKWGVSAVPSPSGHGTGKTEFSDLSWNQVMDKSFPLLFTDISKGEHLKTVLVDFTSMVGDANRTYFEMEFKNVFLTSLNLSGDSSNRATNSGSFAYDFIKMTFTEFGTDGTEKGHTTAEYNLVTGKGSAPELAALFAMGLWGPSVVDTVPIPASLWLLGSGLAGLAGWRRIFRR